MAAHDRLDDAPLLRRQRVALGEAGEGVPEVGADVAWAAPFDDAGASLRRHREAGAKLLPVEHRARMERNHAGGPVRVNHAEIRRSPGAFERLPAFAAEDRLVVAIEDQDGLLRVAQGSADSAAERGGEGAVEVRVVQALERGIQRLDHAHLAGGEPPAVAVEAESDADMARRREQDRQLIVDEGCSKHVVVVRALGLPVLELAQRIDSAPRACDLNLWFRCQAPRIRMPAGCAAAGVRAAPSGEETAGVRCLVVAHA